MQWGKLNQVKSNGVNIDLMANFIVFNFSNTEASYLDVEKEMPENSPKERQLKNSVKKVLCLLKMIFFKEEVLLLESLDNLLSQTESTLSTHFGVDLTK